MSELARLLAPRVEAIIERWTQQVAATVAPGPLPEPVLRDHVADVLRALLTALDRGAVPDSVVHARQHGQQRYQAGFSIDALVREYGLLRGLLLELAEEANLGLSLREVRLLTDFFAVAIAEGVTEYDQQRARVEQQTRTILEEERQRLQRTELALTEARLMSDSALTAGSVGTFTWDIATDRLYGDASFSRLFGIQLDASGAAPLADDIAAMHPDDRAATTSKIQHTVEVGGPYEAEYRIVTGGREVWVVARGRVDRDENGRPVRFPGLLMDITERKQIEEAQRAVTARLATALAAGGLGTFEWDLRLDVLQLDDRAREIFAFTPDEVSTSAEVFARIDPSDRTRVQVETEAGIASQPRMRSEYHLALPNRPPLTVLSFGEFLRDPDGRAERMIGVFRDVTEERRSARQREQLLAAEQVARKEAEDARQEQHDLFMRAPVGICILEGPDHLYTFANPTYRALINGREVVGKTLHEALPDVREMGFDKLLDRVKETGEIFVAREMPIKLEHHRGDEILYLDFAYTPKRNAAGIIDGVMTTALDVTAQVRARQQAEENSRLKDEFIATVSHELRTPLTAMLGWTQMLRSGSVPAERQPRALETIERNARSQAQLIEDLLDMSRILSGKMGLDIQPMEVATVVEGALESIRPTAQAKGIRLQPAVDSCGLVMGDANRLQQVVWNLLTNAVKFTPKGGRVQVLVQCLDSAVEISVADSGQGIAPGFLPHVFERFRQAEGGISRAKGGLGLGLSIVKQLVEMHGGTVSVSSEGEGKGATFTVRLPLSVVRRREAVPPDQPLSTKAAETAPLSGLRVLVVDDEEDTREMLGLLLETRGAAVVQAPSASEGRRLFATERPDVVVSDIGMPGENGYAFIESLRRLPADQGGGVPAVALTAYARSEDRTRALTAGFTGHVAKPVEPAELIAIIASLARHGRAAPT